MRYLSFVFQLILILVYIGCSSTDIDNLKPLATDLDVYYGDEATGFKIKPPLDWAKKSKGEDTVFAPPLEEVDSRLAKSLIVISFIKVTEGDYTPEEFKNLIEQTIEKNSKVTEIEILEFGGTPGKAYCELIVEYSLPKADVVHYYRCLQVKGGYYQVAGSAINERWKQVEQLLNASLKTFEIIQ